MGGFIMTVVARLRQMAQTVRDQSSRGSDLLLGGGGGGGDYHPILACLTMVAGGMCSALLQVVAEVVEVLTKFATIHAAVAGGSLLDSGKQVTELLKRNLLDAFTTYWFPTVVVHTTSCLLAVAWGAAVYLVSFPVIFASSAREGR